MNTPRKGDILTLTDGKTCTVESADLWTNGGGYECVVVNIPCPNFVLTMPLDMRAIVRVERDGVVIWDAATAVEQMELGL